jgi:hypothetical protein
MSIWATMIMFHDDPDPDELGAPIVYHHSGHRPDPADRGGWAEMSGIPGHICDQDDDTWCPYLRMSVNGETVVLDLEQADEVIEALQAWRERVGNQIRNTSADLEGEG